MNTKKIGEKIRRIRTSKGLSQANVAEDLDLTTGAYAKIERGEIDPNTTRLMQIAEILEVNVTAFFGEHGSSLVQESNPGYGYATKHEVENLTWLVQSLIREFEKLREELPGKKEAPKKYAKKKKT